MTQPPPPSDYVMEVEREASDRRMAMEHIERIASTLMGRFFIACDGRHGEGRTCDYCLITDILTTVRAFEPSPFTPKRDATSQEEP